MVVKGRAVKVLSAHAPDNALETLLKNALCVGQMLGADPPLGEIQKGSSGREGRSFVKG